MPGLRKLTNHILVCAHKTCLKEGGYGAAKELKHALKDYDMRERVMISEVDCLDQCEHGPVIVVYPDGVWYGEVDKESAREIVKRHLRDGQVVGKRVLREMREPHEKEA